MTETLDITILGLSITSSWGNGHATIFRGLVRELERAGHRVTFLECDKPWYASHRDLPDPPHGVTYLYRDLEQLQREYAAAVRDADFVMLGSYVPDGAALGNWMCDIARGFTCFYDIDTPVTLAAVERGDCGYLHRSLIPRFDTYFSFTGGPTLDRLEREFGSPDAQPLYCCVDPERYYPESRPMRFDLGYMGTYSADRQPPLETLLVEPARRWHDGRFCVAGPNYPAEIAWPENVKRVEHLPPSEHRGFYNEQRFTLNITRTDMIRAGYAPSVRLFEAAACGVPIISDDWPGLETFFVPGEELYMARTTGDVLDLLRDASDAERLQVAAAARARVLAHHTAADRARQVVEHAMRRCSASKLAG